VESPTIQLIRAWPTWLPVSGAVVFASAALLLAALCLANAWRGRRVTHERERAFLAEQLRAQSASIARLIHQSTTILYTLHERGGELVAVELSENLERLLGYSIAEALAPGWWEAHLHPDDRDEAMRAVRLLATQDVLVHEYRFLRHDGTIVWVRDQVTATARDHGRPVQAAGSWNDVTEQREADRQWRASEATARLKAAALEAAANAILITDRNGRIEWVNAAFSGLTGFDAADAIGRNPRDLVHSGVQDVAFYEHMWDTIVAGGVWEGELTNRRKDGTTYREAQTITPVRDAFGTITHFIGVKRDLTKERALQAQFLEAQKMEVVGRLAGGIAHDFNNLLTIINGECELALDEVDAGDPHRVVYQRVRDAGERATRLTRQLLSFSRRHHVAPTVFPVAAQVAQFAPMLRRLMGEDISLTVTVPAAGAIDLVSMDKAHFEQILLNLVVNARDAMPTGGAITIGTDAPPTSDVVTLVVSDTGAGIPPEVLPRLFEAFFTTKPSGKGTGLGLATVQSIVTEAGGTVTVESEVGVGTTFTISLPRSSDAASAADAATLVAAGGHETIVLVEDERQVRDLAARMLRANGYAVIPMESSRAALDWFAQSDRPVQLLVTDIVMPEITGPELATALSRARPALPVLYMTGYSDERVGTPTAISEGNLVQKPFSGATLALAVRRVLDHAGAR
jgi:PAS domain S-box-containing protein